MATSSHILAWAIPWTEMSSGLQSMRSQRVARGHRRLTLPPKSNTREWQSFGWSLGGMLLERKLFMMLSSHLDNSPVTCLSWPVCDFSRVFFTIKKNNSRFFLMTNITSKSTCFFLQGPLLKWTRFNKLGDSIWFKHSTSAAQKLREGLVFINFSTTIQMAARCILTSSRLTFLSNQHSRQTKECLLALCSSQRQRAE